MDYQREIVLPASQSMPDMEHGSVFFIGTATVLLRYAGFTILTDPNFLHKGEHVHLDYGMRSKRLTEPAITIDQLPPLDCIVLSHLHEDHFDRIAERKLDKTLPVITNPSAAMALKKKGFGRAYGVRTWESLTLLKGEMTLQITALPAQHAPTPLKFFLPPVMGSMLEFQPSPNQTKLRIYITGDTLFYKQLQEIPRRFPEIDLALFHLGGTKILGILLTMDGKQGAEALKIIAPRTVIPIHFNDYPVFQSPLNDFKQAISQTEQESKVRYLDSGGTFTFDIPVRTYA